MRQSIPPTHRSFARKMRADSTKAENVLWQALRNKQLEGLKFKRQVPLDGYILDFVCFEAKLIVEVDGGQHSGSESDAVRDRHFEALGFKVLRFWNDDVTKDIDGVCLACCRFRGHRDKVFDGTGEWECEEGSSAASSSLRR